MSLSSLFVSSTLVLAALVSAHPDHAPLGKRLAVGRPTLEGRETWFHGENHPVHKLFRRGPATDGQQYATVGSPEWKAAYPSDIPTQMPPAWKAALDAAVQAGKIPNIAQSTIVDGSPVYPQGTDGSKMPVCSTYQKCKLPGTIWDAPDNTIGISFDDGPVAGSSDTLYSFLQQQDVGATHFMIGKAILQAPTEFTQAFNMGGDIAVHTWTHRQMTSLSNDDVAMELGWTMEIIHNSTGGRVPRFWRPPTGDCDARVDAIAREVFGLKTVIWNQDTEDWSISNGGTTLDYVKGNLTKWYNGAKSPGLIVLEHELTNETVAGFIDTYPLAIQKGWTITSVAQLNSSLHPYQNSEDTTGQVTPVDDILVSDMPSDAPVPSAPASSATKAPSPTSGSAGAGPGSSSGSSPTTGASRTSSAYTMLPSVVGALLIALVSCAISTAF